MSEAHPTQGQSVKTCCATHKRENGECRRCHKCLDCCGKTHIAGSCARKNQYMTGVQQRRSQRATDAYWASVEAGRQKR